MCAAVHSKVKGESAPPVALLTEPRCNRWWAQFAESNGQFDKALQYYEVPNFHWLRAPLPLPSASSGKYEIQPRKFVALQNHTPESSPLHILTRYILPPTSALLHPFLHTSCKHPSTILPLLSPSLHAEGSGPPGNRASAMLPWQARPRRRDSERAERLGRRLPPGEAL